PFGAEPLGEREPDPARGTCDDRHPAPEVLHGRYLTSCDLGPVDLVGRVQYHELPAALRYIVAQDSPPDHDQRETSPKSRTNLKVIGALDSRRIRDEDTADGPRDRRAAGLARTRRGSPDARRGLSQGRAVGRRDPREGPR